MKLTKKLLAVLLSVAMLAGMVAVGASASDLPQLDENVPSYGVDCLTHDPVNNPYTVKYGFKLYKVDTATDDYTYLEDKIAGNDTYDVSVNPGDVLRVEWWMQTNFIAYGMQAFVAYDNTFLKSTKNASKDYATFEMKSTNLAMGQAFEKVEMGESGDGTFEAPIYNQNINTISLYSAAKSAYNALKNYLPTSWKGTGTAAGNWYNTSNPDIVNADGSMKYNFHLMGLSSTDANLDYYGYAACYNVYQPMVAYHLTVAADAADGSVAELFIPEESILRADSDPKGAWTWVQALDTEEIMNSDYYDESMPQVQTGAAATAQKSTVTYSDGTVAEKVWDIENVTITVGEVAGGGEDDDTTTETTTEAPKVPCNYTALDAAINTVVDTTNCTSDSIAKYEAALAAAKAVERDMFVDEAGANQAQIDAAAKALTDAIAGLTKLGVCNYAELDAAIAQAKALDENDYTTTSWYSQAYLPSYLEAAEAVTRDMIADEAGENQAIIDDATNALRAAIAKLELRADFTALKAALAAAATADTTNCTAASVAEFNAALAAAQDLADFESSTGEGKQSEVDAAAARLNAAITGLTKLGACNYDDLDAAIAAYDALVKANWTPASWTASDVDAKYAAAKAIARDLVADEAGANQATIKAAADALDAAIKALVAVADKADLAAAIAAAPANEDAYTPETWAPFAAALAAANEVNADANATQDAVNNALAALNAAQGELALKADKAALAEAIAAAKALDEANYTPDSWATAKLADAIAAAEVVNDNANASDADVTAALNALAAAVAALEEKADTADLEAAIATLPAVSEEDADPTTWAAYEAALAAAQLVLADANASQDDVDAAEADLLAAIAAVKEKDVVYCDYSDLDDAIAAFEALNEAEYTPNSYAAVKAYYDAAKAIARNLEYTDENQEAIDEATDNLHNGMIRELVKVADKAALKAAIDTVVDTANCTSASIAKYEAALADANAVYADANATQAAVDAAKDALVAAQALEKLPKVDYSDLEAQMDRFEALDAAEWTVESYADAKAAYDAAGALVAEDLYDDEAGENAIRVDEATDALNAAINALKAAVKKDALLAEINKAASIEEDLATDATWADYAAALADAKDVYADDTANQGEVDDATAALAAANAALTLRDLVNYADLDAALALVPELGADEYTAKSWKAYADAKAAAEAIARDLVDNKAGTNQKTVDDAAAALVAAFNGLKVNAANITNVEYDNAGVYTAAAMSYDFTVNGGASKIQVIFPDKGTMTFDRRSTKVSIKSYNEAGEEINYADEEPAYEVWTIVLTLPAAEYQVRAKYNYTWDTENYAFAVEYDEYETAAQTFTVNGETAVTVAKGEVLVFEAITDKTATKIQFVFNDGGTSTYSKSYAKDNGDGTLTWTITRTFAKSYDVNLKVKAPTGWMADYQGSVSVTVK